MSQVDFAATFAEILGYELSNEDAIDSYNILPVLKGEGYSSPLRVATVQNTNKGQYALRQGDWVFINTHAASGQSEPKAYLDHFGLEAFQKVPLGCCSILRTIRANRKTSTRNTQNAWMRCVRYWIDMLPVSAAPRSASRMFL